MKSMIIKNITKLNLVEFCALNRNTDGTWHREDY